MNDHVNRITYTSKGEFELRECLRRAGFCSGDTEHVINMSQEGIDKILKGLILAGEYVQPSIRPGRK